MFKRSSQEIVANTYAIHFMQERNYHATPYLNLPGKQASYRHWQTFNKNPHYHQFFQFRHSVFKIFQLFRWIHLEKHEESTVTTAAISDGQSFYILNGAKISLNGIPKWDTNMDLKTISVGGFQKTKMDGLGWQYKFTFTWIRALKIKDLFSFSPSNFIHF